MHTRNMGRAALVATCLVTAAADASERGALGARVPAADITLPGANPLGLERFNATSELLSTDANANNIHRITAEGAVLQTFSISPNTGIPAGVTSDGEFIYVTDADDGDVDIYTLAGAYQASFNVDSSSPEGITYNPFTECLYIVDPDPNPDRLLIYKRNGSFSEAVPLISSSTDGVAYDLDRNSYWTYDSASDAVIQYDGDFNIFSMFKGNVNAGFATGEGVAVIGDILWVVANFDSIAVAYDVADAPGEPLTPETEAEPAPLNNPILLTFFAAAAALTGARVISSCRRRSA